MFTPEQQQEYKNSDMRRCPECGSDDATPVHIHLVNGGTIIANVVCDNCLALWDDIYYFSHMEATND
jgi:hypothetical protein